MSFRRRRAWLGSSRRTPFAVVELNIVSCMHPLDSAGHWAEFVGGAVGQKGRMWAYCQAFVITSSGLMHASRLTLWYAICWTQHRTKKVAIAMPCTRFSRKLMGVRPAMTHISWSGHWQHRNFALNSMHFTWPSSRTSPIQSHQL